MSGSDNRIETTELKAAAGAFGFNAVGVAPVRPYPHGDFFTEWLRRGWHGSMGYLARNAEKRLDPAKVVPGARSIICLAKLYRTREIPEPLRRDPQRGVISRYAWGDDYHDTLRKPLRALYEWVEDRYEGEVEGRVYVDTGPVLEREAAALAGLGWIGKNTMMMSRELGSYFFLAEIITNVPFAPDAPTTDHCGSCAACLEACPTDAFPEPYVLDATKCVSYLTIELREDIPAALRAGVGNLVFGCDICQEVCPWNRKAPKADAPEYEPRAGLVSPELAPLMSLDDESFRDRFRKSPIKRTKRRGFLRNVAVALGNSGSESAIPALEKGLNDDEPLVRRHVAWALGRIGGERAHKVLKARLTVEADEQTREEIENALNEPD